MGSQWERPRGVSPGNWEYVRASTIASTYDQLLQNDPLTKADGEILGRYLAGPPDGGSSTVIDFGCGSGRAFPQLLERGFSVVGVDLSEPMLERCRIRVAELEAASRVQLVQANLVELDGLATDSIDHGICLFSTLGMIQGRACRKQFLEHARRVIRPSGWLLIHAHNFWFPWRQPGGFRWGLSNLARSLRGQCEWGDRLADYRGVRQLMIHSFRRGELNTDLRNAGLTPLDWWGVEAGNASLDSRVGWSSSLHHVGWLVATRVEA